METSISAYDARTQFGQVMERACSNKERFFVARRGKPKVVIMGIEDYLESVVGASELLEEAQDKAHAAGLDQLLPEAIDAEIAEVRASLRER